MSISHMGIIKHPTEPFKIEFYAYLKKEYHLIFDIAWEKKLEGRCHDYIILQKSRKEAPTGYEVKRELKTLRKKVIRVLIHLNQLNLDDNLSKTVKSLLIMKNKGGERFLYRDNNKSKYSKLCVRYS